MAEFASHAPGTFSWPELATTDQQGGVAFYRALFGWDVNEQPIGPSDMYSIFQMRGKAVAAGYTMRDDERSRGVPPHWNSYVTVENVDESASKAASLGARVLAPAFEVMDAGRMAVLQDPTGAVLQIWQPRRSIGAQILNEPGALCWSELNTRDTKQAEAFYTALFGWGVKHASPSPAMEYTEFSVAGQPSIGMIPMNEHMPAHVPAYWMPYFQVTNTDASAAKITELGGSIMVPAQDVPGTGGFAIGSDPQGAMFAVFQYTERK